MKSIRHGMRVCFGSLMGKEIYRGEDELGTIVITQRGDRRVLSFGNLMEQSSVLMSKPWYLSHEYTQAMLLVMLFVDARHVTLLGLGGGGLVHCLSHFYPHLTIQVVELRQAVIDLAYQWFELPRVPRVQVCHSDAQQYLSRQQPACTDIIFSDLYDSGGMHELQAQQMYIRACHRALTDGGWLVLNFHSMPDNNSPVMQSINELFTEVFVCAVVKGNWIMFCGRSPCAFDDEVLQQRAEALVQRVNMPLMHYFRQLQQQYF